jgi:hypothetical protein
MPHAIAALVIRSIPDLTAWLTLRHSIVGLSILAAAANIVGIVPQLRAMLTVRSSRGQSPVGWMLAATCSGSLLFVNEVGYHATVLAIGNFLSFSGCAAAAMLARYFRDRGGAPADALEVLQDAPEELVSELPATDLHVLTEAVLEEHHRRTGDPIPEATVTEMPTGEFRALAEVVLVEHQRRTGESKLSLAGA